MSSSVEGADVISQLPFELLGQIFKHCPRDSSGTPSARSAPLLLCHVCSTWRAAAFSLPQLWDTLFLQFPRYATEPPQLERIKSIVNLSKIWLTHIGSSTKLSLCLHWHGGTGLRLLEDFVLAHSNRLCRLDLFLPSNADFARFFVLPMRRIEHLEHISVRLSYTYISTPVAMAFFQFAPRLRKVLLDGVDAHGIDTPLSQISLPWTQLTHLEIHNCLPHTTWQIILRQCVHLERCSMYIDFETQVPNPPKRQATALPNLIDLTVRINNRSDLTPHDGWFDDLVFPALKELEIQHAHLSPAMAERLDDTVPLSSLQRLVVISQVPDCSAVVNLLRTTMAAEELGLWITGDESEPGPIIGFVLESLVCPPEEASPCVLTRLRALELWVGFSEDIEAIVTTFVEVVNSRWLSPRSHATDAGTEVSRLQKIVLHAMGRDDREMEHANRLLRRDIYDGLDIWIDTEIFWSRRSEQW